MDCLCATRRGFVAVYTEEQAVHLHAKRMALEYQEKYKDLIRNAITWATL